MIDDIEQGRIDEAIIKLAVYSAGDVTAFADATLGRLRLATGDLGCGWAGASSTRGVDKAHCANFQDYLGVTPTGQLFSAMREMTCR